MVLNWQKGNLVYKIEDKSYLMQKGRAALHPCKVALPFFCYILSLSKKELLFRILM